jgi:predicted  nucleic acid-binding Zn-ribbon protein
MRQELELLKELQALDTQCRNLELARKHQPEVIGEKRREMESRKASFEEQKKAVLELRKSVDIKDLNLKEIESKLAKLRGQLVTVKTNKEYSAFLSQIGADEADKSRLEDEILQLMGKVEEAQRSLQESTQQFAQERKQTEEFVAKAEEEQRAAEKQISGLKAQREGIRRRVPREFLDPYERLLGKRDGVALTCALRRVPLSRSAEESETWVCQGCYMNLTMQTIASLMTSEKPVFCKSCGRMLYLEGQPEQAESEGKA